MRDDNIKICNRCGQRVPAGLLVCVQCAMEASNLPNGRAAQAKLGIEAEIACGEGDMLWSKGGLTHRGAMEKLQENGFVQPKHRPRRKKEDDASLPFDASIFVA